jgi:hypothetical protein
LSKRTGLKVYFAHPHSPWERGRNENTNGLLRQYLPKGEDLSGYSQQQLDEIAASLNARSIKSLGWKAPAELFQPKGAFDFKNTGLHQTQSTVLHFELESARYKSALKTSYKSTVVGFARLRTESSNGRICANCPGLISLGYGFLCFIPQNYRL